MSAIRVQQLSKSFGTTRALDDFSLHLEAGEMVALMGASGSGKSTLIRHVAGVSPADSTGAGSVAIGGAVMQSGGKVSRESRAVRRHAGVVFQQFNLVNRLSVVTNALSR